MTASTNPAPDASPGNAASAAMIAPSDGETEFSRAVWRLRGDIRAYPRRKRAANGKMATVFVIEDPLQGKFYELGRAEYLFASRLDGRRTVQQTLATIEQAERLSLQQAQHVIQWLLSTQLLKQSGGAHGERLHEMERSLKRREAWQRYNPLTARLPLSHPDRWMARLARQHRWMVSRLFAVVVVLIATAALFQLAGQGSRLQSAARGVMSPQRWLWIALCWLVLKVVHEFAHGIVCRIYGGAVREAGIMLLYFFPVAYVDVTSSWRFRSKWQRIHVAAAGMQVELLIAAVAALVWSATTAGVLNDACFYVMVAASVTTVLFNANPLMRFDGYYILSDLLGVPNLYGRSQQHVAAAAKQLLFGIGASRPASRPSQGSQESPALEARSAPGPRWLLSLYGVAVVLWRVIVVAGIVLMLSQLFYGAGLVLACFVAASSLLVPLGRLLRYLQCSPEVDGAARRRFAMTAFAMVALIVPFLLLPLSPRPVAPGVIEFSSLSTVRAKADGFATEVLVEDGQWVERGQPLLMLVNLQLMSELEQHRREVTSAEIEARKHQQAGDEASRQAALQRLQSHRERLLEVEGQVSSQSVTAPIAGRVMARGLSHLVGQFFEEGDELLTIGDEAAKELRISMDQRQMEGWQQAEVRPNIRTRIPGVGVFRGTIETVEPLASTRPLHVSLCANAGGPLPVKLDGEKPRLIEPRFTAVIPLPRELAKQLHAGRRVTAVVELPRHSLWSYLRQQVQQWIKSRV